MEPSAVSSYRSTSLPATENKSFSKRSSPCFVRRALANRRRFSPGRAVRFRRINSMYSETFCEHHFHDYNIFRYVEGIGQQLWSSSTNWRAESMNYESKKKNDKSPLHWRSSSHLGMSNISAKRGGNLSLVQFLLNQSRRFACLAPRALNSGILCETLDTPEQPPAEVASPETVWFRNPWTFNASRRRSWSLCTAFTSFSPGLSPRSTAPEKRPSSVSDNWWAFRADVNCIKADTKSGCFCFTSID